MNSIKYYDFYIVNEGIFWRDSEKAWPINYELFGEADIGLFMKLSSYISKSSE